MAGGSSEPGRTVTSKVLSILEAFEKSRGALSLTEIAEKSGLPLSTAHRLVNELTDWGLLSREPNGRYQLGIRLWELAQNTGRQLRDAARPYIQDLFSLTGETAHLAVRSGHEVLYIDRVYGSKRLPRASRVGGRLPMHATAVGKVILAFEEDWVRDAYLNRQLERHTAHTHVDPEKTGRRTRPRSGNRATPPRSRKSGWAPAPSPSRSSTPAGSAPRSAWCFPPARPPR